MQSTVVLQVLSEDMYDGQNITTLQRGRALRVSISEGAGVITVSNASVTMPNVVAGNGVLHAVDRVLQLNSEDPDAAYREYALFSQCCVSQHAPCLTESLDGPNGLHSPTTSCLEQEAPLARRIYCSH